MQEWHSLAWEKCELYWLNLLLCFQLVFGECLPSVVPSCFAHVQAAAAFILQKVFLQICSNLNEKCSCLRITDFPNWVCGIWEDRAPQPLAFVFPSPQWVLLEKFSGTCFSFHQCWNAEFKCFLSSFSGHVLWVGVFSGCWTNYCSKYKGASAEGRKTTVFFPGGDMGDRKPQGLGEATAAPHLVCSLHFSRRNH